jgi:hypothetical protein
MTQCRVKLRGAWRNLNQETTCAALVDRQILSCCSWLGYVASEDEERR